LHDLTLKLPFENNYFNKIVSNNVLYTIKPDKRKFVIEEFYRVLKPGGILVISNIIKGWKPIRIYSYHLKKDLGQIGLIKLIVKITKYLWPTLKIFYYAFKIKNNSGAKNHMFVEIDEQKKLMQEAGFKKISGNVPTYATQAILNIGIK